MVSDEHFDLAVVVWACFDCLNKPRLLDIVIGQKQAVVEIGEGLVDSLCIENTGDRLDLETVVVAVAGGAVRSVGSMVVEKSASGVLAWRR